MTNSRLLCGLTLTLIRITGSHVRVSTFGFPPSSPFFSEPTRVDDLRRLYLDFDNIYRRHVDEAKFGVVNDAKFRSLKERLIAEGDLPHAPGQPTLVKSDKKKGPGKGLSSSVSKRFQKALRSKNTSEESPQKEVKKMTSDISDSDFLCGLKGIQDKDLGSPIHEAMVLAHTYLSSLIDITVNTMTYAVLKMQQDACKIRVSREVETEEKMALDRVLVNFIRDVNLNSAGRKTS